MFSKSSVFSGLLLGALVVTAQGWLRANRPPLDLSPAVLDTRWQAVAFPPLDDGRARLAGAWRLEVTDRRAGGFSGLALDGGRLLGLTDGGMLVWLPRPAMPGRARIRPLPAVAGNPNTKVGRDSEALARIADGWLVAFEQNHQLIVYDAAFRRARQRIALAKRGLRDNRGIEAISVAGGVRAYPEATGISDAASDGNGRSWLLRRSFGLGGFTARISSGSGIAVELPLAPLDNPEGLAAEALPGRVTRLWVMTDNDQRRWQRTLLLAIDVPAAAGG